MYISGPVFLGGENGKAGSQTLGKAGDQKHNRSGRPNRRQGAAAYIAPYDDGVNHVVELLEHIAYE